MNHEVMITCAITGDDTKVTKSPHCPMTPEQIAASAVEAAQAGAAMVHIHVREPDTGAFSMETRHYREVVKRIRESKVDVLVNLTCGMGGYIYVGDHGMADTPAPGTDFCRRKTACGTSSICATKASTGPTSRRSTAAASISATATAPMSRRPITCARARRSCATSGSRPSSRSSTPAICGSRQQMIKEGLIPAPPLVQLCCGIPYGVPADTGHLLAMVNALPAGSVWTSFGISRMQMPWVAQSILLGGNVRVGLEDNLYLSRGVYASNAQLVTKARTIIEAMGARIITPAAGPRPSEDPLSVARAGPEDLLHVGRSRVDRLQRPPARRLLPVVMSLACDALMDQRRPRRPPIAHARVARCSRSSSTCISCTRSRRAIGSTSACASSAADRKRLHAAFDFYCERYADPVATGELMLLHVHQGESTGAQPFPTEVAAAIERLKAQTANLNAPGPGSRRTRTASAVNAGA